MSYHSGIKQTPYCALFGMEVQIGLVSSSFLIEVFDRLQSEDDLKMVFSLSLTVFKSFVFVTD